MCVYMCVCVFGGDCDGGISYYGGMAGKVTTGGCDNSLGAECLSNNAGELEAMRWALAWALQSGATSVTLASDSMFAVDVTRQVAQTDEQHRLVSVARTLWTTIEQRTQLNWEHIRSHTGHP